MGRILAGGLLLGGVLSFAAFRVLNRAVRARDDAALYGAVLPPNRDRMRQAANVVLSIAQQLAPLLAFVTGVGVDISTRAAQGEPTAIEPAGYAFGIWAFIYPACIAYGVYQTLPSRRENPLLRRIGHLTASAFLATTLWAVAAQMTSDDWLWLTVPIIVWMLVTLLAALGRMAKFRGRLTPADRAFVVVPLSVFAGWITVATFANTSVFSLTGFDNFGLSDAQWTILRLVAATVLAALATRATGGNLLYALTVVWALVGIVVTNVVYRPDVAVAAMAAAAAILELVVLAWVRAGSPEEA
jgi:hypothetical protein